jgi:hypothetical protein
MLILFSSYSPFSNKFDLIITIIKPKINPINRPKNTIFFLFGKILISGLYAGSTILNGCIFKFEKFRLVIYLQISLFENQIFLSFHFF